MALSKPLSKHSESLPSLEPEVDSYKAKYEHLKATVKQLYKERQTLLARVHGLESLSTLLSETRQENKELHEKNSKLEATIATYQGRLSSIGASLSLSFEEGEAFVPGPSRQLLDNLVKENARLRQNLKFTNCDPQRLTDLTEEKIELEQQIKDLQAEIQKLSKDNNDLKLALKSSPEIKDGQIYKLRHEIEEIQQNSITHEVLYQSLSEECDLLKKKLKETGEMCQRLVQQLDDKNSETRKRSPDLATEQVKQKNLQMESQLKEVIQMNSRWQSYNDQREQYVTRLHKQLAEAEEKLASAQTKSSSTMNEEQQKAIDQMILAYKNKVETAQEEKEKVEEELRNVKRELQQQREAIVTLREQLENQQLAVRQGPSSVDRDHIQMLQQQVQVFKEDFESERKDREAAQQRISDLENELQITRTQLQQFQGHTLDILHARRQHALSPHHESRHRGLTARGSSQSPIHHAGYNFHDGDITVDGENQDNDQGYDEVDAGYDLCDGLQVAEKNEDMLECPRCQKAYPHDRHNELLDHIDVCCD